MREVLLNVGKNYAAAKSEQFGKHPVANSIRGELKTDVRKSLGDLSDGMILKSSPGQGAWASVPWLAIFDPLVTTRPTHGYFVAYLFAPNKSQIHLTLNQGTNSILKEFSAIAAYQILRDRASLMRARLPEFASRFQSKEIHFGSNETLPKGYEAGHVFGKSYDVKNMPAESVLESDLRELVKAYLILSFRGGNSLLEDKPEEVGANIHSITEVRRYQMHRRMDRHPDAGPEAKKYHGYKCQACSFVFAESYGDIGLDFIEAHHLRPLNTLEEGIAVKYNVATDFAVLCSNCHRMIHRMLDPSDLNGFREIIKKSSVNTIAV